MQTADFALFTQNYGTSNDLKNTNKYIQMIMLFYFGPFILFSVNRLYVYVLERGKENTPKK